MILILSQLSAYSLFFLRSKFKLHYVMSYQMYRITTLGEALEHTLNEFTEDGQIPKEIVPRVMAVFDKFV